MTRIRILTLFIIALLCAGCISAASASDVSDAIEDALAYLAKHQQPDGGFAEPGVSGSQASPTWFAVTAITATGGDPAKWNVNGVSTLDFWNTPQSGSDGTGELAKMCCILAQYGIDPHNYNGKNYVQELKSKMKPNGQMGDFVYTTYWGIFGLLAAGEDASKPVAWLKTQQQADGGWSWADGAVSDSDDTAASIMALIAAGVSPNDPSIQKAVQFLRSVQEPSGGFNYGYYSESNLASTAWVVQALCAAGIDPETVTTNGKSPMDYLLSLQQADGSFKYTEYTTDSPVSMTARAVAALAGKPYPILPSSTTPPTSTPASSWKPVTVTDALGSTVTITEKPQRIVSLAPANTEILFALGAGDMVVGVTEYCTYPEEATKKPIIGGYTTVNVERVITQKPDLIVAYYGNGLDTINYLKRLGYTVITLNSDSVDGTFNDIELLGKVTGHTAEAKSLIEDMQERIDAVTEKLAGVTDRPTVAHCMWADPLWVSGSNTFQDEIIALSGGVNAFDTVNGWGTVTLERFLTTDPKYILVDSGMGMGVGGYDVIKDSFYNDPRMAGLTAVKNNNVYVMNADIIDRGGPRIVDCIEDVAAILYPDLFERGEQGSTPAQSPGFGLALTLAAVACGLFLTRRDYSLSFLIPQLPIIQRP